MLSHEWVSGPVAMIERLRRNIIEAMRVVTPGAVGPALGLCDEAGTVEQACVDIGVTVDALGRCPMKCASRSRASGGSDVSEMLRVAF